MIQILLNQSLAEWLMELFILWFMYKLFKWAGDEDKRRKNTALDEAVKRDLAEQAQKDNKQIKK